MLSNIPKASSTSEISSSSKDVPVLLDLEKESLACSVQNLLDTTLHFEDIPVILRDDPVSEECPEHEESTNLINFDENDVHVVEETSEHNKSLELMDLDEIVEEMNRSFEPEPEPDVNNPSEAEDLNTESEAPVTKKRKPENENYNYTEMNPAKTIVNEYTILAIDTVVTEYAKSARSICSTCKTSIANGTVRIGKICRKVISKDSVIKVPVWYHEECLKRNHLDKLKQISEFVGFGELSKEDQV